MEDLLIDETIDKGNEFTARIVEPSQVDPDEVLHIFVLLELRDERVRLALRVADAEVGLVFVFSFYVYYFIRLFLDLYFTVWFFYLKLGDDLFFLKFVRAKDERVEHCALAAASVSDC